MPKMATNVECYQPPVATSERNICSGYQRGATHRHTRRCTVEREYTNRERDAANGYTVWLGGTRDIHGSNAPYIGQSVPQYMRSAELSHTCATTRARSAVMVHVGPLSRCRRIFSDRAWARPGQAAAYSGKHLSR